MDRQTVRFSMPRPQLRRCRICSRQHDDARADADAAVQVLDANAVPNRLVVAERQVKVGVRRIDDDGAAELRR